MRHSNVFARTLAITAAVLAPLIVPPPALAETGRAPVDDEVILELTVQDWVETATATVVIAADLAITAGSFGAARVALEAELKGISEAAPWRLTRFNKLRDEAGYERWRVLAEARLPGAALSSLGGKVAKASWPGRGFRIDHIDYAPNLEERETALAKLRARLYGLASREIAALNKAFPSRSFRLGAIEFVPRMSGGRVMMMDAPRMARAKSSRAEASPAAAVAQKLVVNARVTVSAKPAAVK